MSPDIVVNHAHCWICGRAMAHTGEKGAQICSDACKAEMEKQNKKRKTMMYFLYGAMALTLILLLAGLRGA